MAGNTFGLIAIIMHLFPQIIPYDLISDYLLTEHFYIHIFNKLHIMSRLMLLRNAQCNIFLFYISGKTSQYLMILNII
jgi:hypothetical protein